MSKMFRNTTAGECMAFLELPTNETIITGLYSYSFLPPLLPNIRL